MVGRLARRGVLAAGFVFGAGTGGWLGWRVGQAAWHWTGGSDLVWGVLFFLSFVGVLFGLVAPLTLVRYATDRVAPLGGEPGDAFMADSWAANDVVDMAVGRQLGSALGYLAVVAVYLGLAAIGGYLNGGAGLGPLDVLALLDAVGGGALGGLAVVSGLDRLGADRSPGT